MFQVGELSRVDRLPNLDKQVWLVMLPICWKEAASKTQSHGSSAVESVPVQFNLSVQILWALQELENIAQYFCIGVNVQKAREELRNVKEARRELKMRE